MRYISNLTEKNVKALEALPPGFQIEFRVLGPYNPYETYETATVVEFINTDGEKRLRLLSYDWSLKKDGSPYIWELYGSTCHTGQEHLSYGSGAELVSVRWYPKAAEKYQQLFDTSAFTHAVQTVLAEEYWRYR